VIVCNHWGMLSGGATLMVQLRAMWIAFLRQIFHRDACGKMDMVKPARHDSDQGQAVKNIHYGGYSTRRARLGYWGRLGVWNCVRVPFK